MKNTTFSLLFILAILSACETVVNIKIPEEPSKLVVNSTLDPDEFIKVHVSQDQHILFERDYKTVEGAKVEIFENGTLLTTLPDSANGSYISATYTPKRGKTYRMVVAKKGFEEASAEVTIPQEAVKIAGIELDTINQEGGTYLRFDIEIDDDKTKENFYEISILKEQYVKNYDYIGEDPVLLDSVLVTELLSIESRDPGLEEFQSYGLSILFNDELFNGKLYNMKVLTYLYYNMENYGKPTYYVIVGNTSKSYFSYELSFQLQRWTDGDPFSEPVQVYSNIKNGYGIFGASAYSTFVVE